MELNNILWKLFSISFSLGFCLFSIYLISSVEVTGNLISILLIAIILILLYSNTLKRCIIEKNITTNEIKYIPYSNQTTETIVQYPIESRVVEDSKVVTEEIISEVGEIPVDDNLSRVDNHELLYKLLFEIIELYEKINIVKELYTKLYGKQLSSNDFDQLKQNLIESRYFVIGKVWKIPKQEESQNQFNEYEIMLNVDDGKGKTRREKVNQKVRINNQTEGVTYDKNLSQNNTELLYDHECIGVLQKIILNNNDPDLDFQIVLSNDWM